jgi:hypothetical protein
MPVALTASGCTVPIFVFSEGKRMKYPECCPTVDPKYYYTK